MQHLPPRSTTALVGVGRMGILFRTINLHYKLINPHKMDPADKDYFKYLCTHWFCLPAHGDALGLRLISYDHVWGFGSIYHQLGGVLGEVRHPWFSGSRQGRGYAYSWRPEVCRALSEWWFNAVSATEAIFTARMSWSCLCFLLPNQL